MRKIKSYKEFVNENINDPITLDNVKIRLDKFSKDVIDFKNKFKSLENLILNNKDGKDIKSNINKIIGNNKILSLYLPIIHLKKQINDVEIKIKYDDSLLKERQADLQLSNSLTDPNDKAEQIKKNTERIKEVDDRIKDNNQKLLELEKTLKTEEDSFKKKTDKSKKDLQDKLKNLNKGDLLKVTDKTPDNPDKNVITKDFTR